MLPETSVSFRTEDEKLLRVCRAAEQKCRLNLKRFGGDTVLVEGGGYEKIWLETQPMGGEMYALRNLEAAMNNSLLFMRHQRADGRMPGSIQYTGGKCEPRFNKYQGFCFPFPALNLYYLSGRDRIYLEQLKDSLIRFDNGSVISVEASFTLNLEKDRGTIEFFGTKAGAKLDPELHLYSSLNGYMTNINFTAPTALSFDGLFANEINHFVSCVKDGRSLTLNFKDE